MNTYNRAKEIQNVRTQFLPFGEVRRGFPFNAFNCMKAYSYNGERYGYYGYDASGERTYKYDIFSAGSWTNQTGGMNVSLQIDKMMLYPNGYLNMNQNGEYTKHYYADALRIASKIGNGFSQDLCYEANQIGNEVDSTYLDERGDRQYVEMKEELSELIHGNQVIDVLPIPYPDTNLCNLSGSGIETALFFYHPDHLGSTGMVTDNSSNITQGFLYAPFGEIITEFNPSWESGRIPKYTFNAKELDEENGMYYYSARYYAPPTFISRDPMFEKYPSISPYTYCANNPMKYVDPDGRKFVVPRVRIEGQKGRYNVTFDGTTATMQQAGRKSSGEVMQYQSGTNQFVDNMVASYNYIVDNGADVDGAMQKMAASDIDINVVKIANTAEYSNGVIRMDFSKGAKVDRDDGESGYQSPALGFWSEVYHSFIDKLDINAKNTYQDKNNRDREENYVHVTKEGAVIDALKTKNPSNGETKRGKYEDAWKAVRMKNVTDTEP